MNSSQKFNEDVRTATPQAPIQPPLRDDGRLAAEIKRAKVTPIKTLDMNNDTEMTARVAHVLKPGEKLMEFYSRTGLSKAQAALMSPGEILGFCLRAEENAKEEQNVPFPAWQPKQIPAHFEMD